MAFDTPRDSLLFSLERAISSYPVAPPRKKDQREMEEWRKALAAHILKKLELNWEFSQIEIDRTKVSALIG